MTDNTTICLFAGFLLAGIVSALCVSGQRHRKDLSAYLEPTLKQHGFKFISAVYPGLFKVDPFPKIEFERGRPQSKVGGIRGEYSEYRIVSFSDSNGQVYSLWAVVEFEMFRFRRVRWRAKNKNLLPKSILPLLEN
jgi:hypothetical protein